MFIGQFCIQSAKAATDVCDLTQKKETRLQSVGFGSGRHASKSDRAFNEDSRFPEVDDILDRLTNDPKIVKLRTQAR